MLEQLTRKEQSIVWLLMQGLAPKKIASKLRTSYIIIHLHLSHIRKKLSVHSTIEIMRCVGRSPVAASDATGKKCSRQMDAIPCWN